jgi:hypothetical protein
MQPTIMTLKSKAHVILEQLNTGIEDLNPFSMYDFMAAFLCAVQFYKMSTFKLEKARRYDMWV